MTEKKPLKNNENNIHHLVWLDHNLENSSNIRKLNQLRELDDKIKTFIDEEKCVDYILKQDDKNTKSYIIFIISGALSEEIIPKIHDCTCILTIFIFCARLDHFENIKYPKLRAICTDSYELFDRIENCMNRDQVSIDFSLFNNQKATESGKFK
jgi:hypothetical protein